MAIAVSATALVLGWGPGIYYICILGITAIGLADLYASLSLPSKICVIFPETVRMSRNRDAVLCFQIQKHAAFPARITIGLPFPESRFKTVYEKKIFLSENMNTFDWPITGLKQGASLMDVCHIQMPSRLGLWEIKTSEKIQCTLNVYPDMSKEKKSLAGLLTGAEYGIHTIKNIGKGREFEHLREYLPGDMYEDIHWKATAKRGIPVTKIFQVEKTQNIYVMIDASRLSARNAAAFSDQTARPIYAAESILEKFITTALSIGLTARQQGDNFGLGVFTDKMERFLLAGTRANHFNLCRDTLFTLEPRQVTPDFNEWITFVGNKIRKRSLIILLTSLDDPAIAENLLNHIHILGRRHLVMINMLNPASANPLFSADTIESIDDIYGHLAGHVQWHFLRKFEKSLSRMGIGFHLHSLPDLTVNIISKYMEIKQRQAL
ncbi:MAG: DUF58 domain-containing protein [Proteobacteria bacterium]|nr:DUF58 domain-containing protein [Pseudomonadota bacterium]MBU1389228.1 DUF58 domain-containing protein [Pseudomonadota bacterium]MBU1544792.1 DUF58 domain-containing protein [Pseudomonadota bacterium]MBU2481896.1 DUF58 domain-containing protein [Pseudomonadota bacterium]